MKCFTLVVCQLAITCTLVAQKVGIGTTTPRFSLQVHAADSNLLLISNSNGLNTNVRSSLYFRTGTWYTGAIKTIGQGTTLARLAFFTYADTDSSKLEERLSITDAGNVGIGSSSPTAKLQVTGGNVHTLLLHNPDAFTNSAYSGIAFMAGSNQLTGAIRSNVSYGNEVGSYGSLRFYYGGPSASALTEGMVLNHFGNVGIGTNNPQLKLDVNGASIFRGEAYFEDGATVEAQSLMITNAKLNLGPGSTFAILPGSGAGKLLTSDASGNATWQTLSGKGFKVYLNSDASISSNIEFALGNCTERFDDGDLFTNGSNSFTAPQTGLYQVIFNAYITCSNFSTNGSFRSQIMVNNSNTQNTGVNSLLAATGATTATYNHSNTQLVKLTAGAVLTVVCGSTFTSGTATLEGGNGFYTTTLSVHLVE